MSAAALWKPSPSAGAKCARANATVNTHCADHAIAGGTHGCNCLAGSWASVVRPSMTAGYLMNAHCNYKSNFINKDGETETEEAIVDESYFE